MRRVCVVAVSLVFASCAKLEDGARDAFRRDVSCDGTVTARPDIDVYARTFPSVQPPTDVAADPQRLAIWTSEQARAQAFYRERFSAFEVKGCNTSRTYSCAHPNASRGGANDAATSCTPLP
jgi:hypothetical protein